MLTLVQMCCMVLLIRVFSNEDKIDTDKKKHFPIQLIDENSVMHNNNYESEVGQIVLVTFECFTVNSVLVRNLIFSISRYTIKEHPVRLYIGHTFDKELLHHPERIICGNLDKCKILLKYLRVEKYIDVKFFPVLNNSYVKSFRPCSSSHLWSPELLPDEKKVIRLDRDMIVMQDLYPLWKMFTYFPDEVAMALCNERNSKHEIEAAKYVSPYRSGISDGKGPYVVPPFGVNSGLILYDLEKMRQYEIVKDFEFILKLNMDLPLGDQDVINYFLIQQPFRYRTLPCKWNRRADPASETDHCYMTKQNGTKFDGIFHGSRKMYLVADAHNREFILKEMAAANSSTKFQRLKNRRRPQKSFLNQMHRLKLEKKSQKAALDLVLAFLRNDQMLRRSEIWSCE